MAKDLSDTWILINIKADEYCLNSMYSKGITTLKTDIYKNPIKNAFIKGNYDVYGAIIPVIDTRRILGYKSIDDEKIEYAAYINNIIYEQQVWIDQLEWEVFTKNNFTGIRDFSGSNIEARLQELKSNDRKINTLVNKVIKSLKIIYSLGNDIAYSDELNTTKKSSLLEEIKRQYNNYVVKNLNKLIELNNDKLTEECVVIDCKGIRFGLTADKISMITNKAKNLTKTSKDKVSAGTIELKNHEYNIINLTMLTNIARNGG